jgi:hypothetical protein
MTGRTPPPQPFRWTLSAHGGACPDAIGSLTEGHEDTRPGAWFLGELTACTAKVLARSDGADLRFLGRSLDSMYDLLTGALEHRTHRDALRRLPVSCPDDSRWSAAELRRFREHLAAAGLEPYALARRKRPLALVDVVAYGRSFGTLHRVLAAWIEESREPWPVIRRKLRYIGVTSRGSTSPHHWRWQQAPESAWVRTLPAGSVLNVSLEHRMWTLLADAQPKVTRSFPHWHWFAEGAGRPEHHDGLGSALAMARALVEAGRGRAVREELIRLMAREPGFGGREQRALALALRSGLHKS